MEKMIYGNEWKREVLMHETYKGFEFYILNLGYHPTAYVNVISLPQHKEKDYEEIIYVHGGITFENDKLEIEENKVVKGYFIGWDYAHYDDYSGLNMLFSFEGKQWTTEEIFEDVKDVINQIIAMEESK